MHYRKKAPIATLSDPVASVNDLFFVCRVDASVRSRRQSREEIVGIYPAP
jgi:hypothetical protein